MANNQITVKVGQGKNGWWCKCSYDEHTTMGRVLETAKSKMETHFDKKHQGFETHYDVV